MGSERTDNERTIPTLLSANSKLGAKRVVHMRLTIASVMLAAFVFVSLPAPAEELMRIPGIAGTLEAMHA
jgi:hypothetical protein